MFLVMVYEFGVESVNNRFSAAYGRRFGNFRKFTDTNLHVSLDNYELACRDLFRAKRN